MTQGREEQIKSLFAQVADIPRDKRLIILKQVCGNDKEMIDEVLALCEGDEESEAQDYWEKGAWVLKSSTPGRKKMIGEIIRGYKIINDLGGGGMGEVYLAQRVDGMLDRKAIIKIVGSHLPKQEWGRFIGEIQAQDIPNHPNIAQIFDAGQLEDGRPFMIMEYVEGRSLRDMLIDRQAKPIRAVALPLEVVAEITEQVCAGLAEAHKEKLVHRDIKPENLIVRTEGNKLKVKIIDFGLALPQESNMLPTRKPTSGIVGTPEYMSPEQVMPERYYLEAPGEKPSPRADIYAMGVVIYEMLTGRRPFSGSGYEVAVKHAEGTPIAPSKVRSDLRIPESVDRVVLKALSKKPQERQKSIDQLAQELRATIKQPDIPQADVVKTQADVVKTEALHIASNRYKRKLLLGLPFVLAGLLIALYFKSWEADTTKIPAPTIAVSPTLSTGLALTPSPATNVSMMTVSVIRQGKNGQEEDVSPDTTFHSGEGVRVSVQADQRGFVYILQQGASGKVSILYPDPRIGSGNNQITKGQRVSIPSGNGWFKFDRNSGTETVYLLYAQNKTEGLMKEIEKDITENGSALISQLEKQAIDLSVSGSSLRGQGVLVGVLRLRHL